ncbi:plasmid replication protein, CyRepA1 family [Crocosphaera sp. Alani8]|uniref:plasmid replication protein, CyRepA1 family n=1 Tax=Crocosphaera sp. Alani8 TaxID=3038952 RepID=UPI00313CF7AB
MKGNTGTQQNQNQTFAHIQAPHYQEWLESAVAPAIIALNVKSLSGNTPYEYLFYSDDIKRLNTGRLTSGYLNKYSHLDNGGWWVNGVNPLTGEEQLWGQFKSDTPRVITEVKGDKGFGGETISKEKIIKYEAPPKIPTEAMFLRVTYRIGLNVFRKAGLGKEYAEYAYHQYKKSSRKLNNLDRIKLLDFIETEDKGFWPLVIDQNLPICITEGAKKAGALLSIGIAAISIPGIWNGCPTEKDKFGNTIGLPRLIPQLALFATKDREINICFDQDEKLKTRITVKKATERLGGLFSKAGCQVKVVEWNAPEKGVDDLIYSKGQDYFESVYNSRLSLTDYKLKGILTLFPDLTIKEQFIPNSLQYPPNAKLIGVQSLHGTGKTEWLAHQVQQCLDNQQKVIVIVHREQLARELARRFGMDYRTEINKNELGKGQFGYALCIDSLHNKAKYKPFDPEHPQWEDVVVVIDEVEQVLWHLLNGGTCRENRVKILTNFKKLLQRAAMSNEGKIFIADADLCSISINYIEQLIGYQVPKFIVKNDYVPDLKRLLFHLKGKNPSGLLKQLENNLKKGHKVIVHTDGQTYGSKWGTRNLEAYLRQKFPDLKILRVDGPSVKDKTHPAQGCIDKLNEVFPKFDIVICSPVIETGVSINCDHFDSVYVLSHGVQTIDAVIQTLQRVRSNVPRYLWTKSFSPNQIGNGSTDVKSLLSSTHKLASAQIKLLQSMGITEANNVVFYEENDDLKTCAPSLLAWAKRAVVLNHQNYHFSKNLIKKLEGLGYELQEKCISKKEMEAVSESMKEVKKENYGNHTDRVSSSPKLEDKTYQEWKERDDLTEAEEETLKKAEISRCYLTEEVSPSMVEKHDQGWLTKLQLLYYSTVGNQYLKDREKRNLLKLKEQSDNGELFKPDLCKSSLAAKIFLLKHLDIFQFLDPDAEFDKHSLEEWYEMISTPAMKSDIKTVFGFSVGHPDDSAIGAAQRFLKKLDLQLISVGRKRRNGKQVRIYKGCNVNPDQRGEIFERWLKRDEANSMNEAA